MKLEGIDLLDGRNGRPVYIILFRSFEAEEARRIGAEGQIESNGTDGSSVTDSESNRLDHVIEIAQILLAKAEADIAEAAVYIAGIVKQHASEILSIQRKPQLEVINKHCISAQRKSG